MQRQRGTGREPISSRGSEQASGTDRGKYESIDHGTSQPVNSARRFASAMEIGNRRPSYIRLFFFHSRWFARVRLLVPFCRFYARMRPLCRSTCSYGLSGIYRVSPLFVLISLSSGVNRRSPSYGRRISTIGLGPLGRFYFLPDGFPTRSSNKTVRRTDERVGGTIRATSARDMHACSVCKSR